MPRNIEFILIDVDGTLTDGYYHVDELGSISKSFFTRDFWAIGRALEEGFRVVFVTGAKDPCTYAKAAAVGVDVIGDSQDKVADTERTLGAEGGFSWERTAFIGDAENDLEAMAKAAFAACPSDAIPELLHGDMSFISNYPGGGGAVYETIRHIFDREGIDWIAS